MKRYRLLKDLPGWNAGSVFSQIDGSSQWVSKGSGKKVSTLVTDTLNMISSPSVLLHHDWSGWFEEITEPEKPKRWRAKEVCGYYYFINSCIVPVQSIDHGYTDDDNHHSSGNYFKTRGAAQVAADAIKALLEYAHADKDESDGAWNRAAYRMEGARIEVMKSEKE